MRVACYRNFAACFQRVLVDGGKHRIFSADDKQIFDDDFCAIKAEVHRLEDLMDVEAMERLMTLLSMETVDLIGLYEKVVPREGDLIYRTDTILKIVSHRDDRR